MDPANKRPARRPAPAKRRPRGKSSPLPLIIIALATLLIVALAIIIPRCASGGGDESVPAWSESEATPTQTLAAPTPTPDAPEAQAAQGDPNAQRYAGRANRPERAATARPRRTVRLATSPQATPAAAQFAQRTVEENNGVVPAPIPTPEGEGYLPVFSKAETTEKIIAITVDDCFQTENLRQIVQCAIDNGGKLTILPIGQNLERESLQEVIRYAYENGMELENHTYTHPAFYRMSTEDMALGDLHEQPRRQRDAGRGLSDALHAHARRRQPPRSAHPPVHRKDGLLRHGPLDAERLLLQRGRTEERRWRRATSTCSTPRTTTLASSSASSPTPRSRATGW